MQRYRAGEDLDEYEDDLEDQYEDDEDQYEDEEDEEEEEEEKEKPRSAEEIKYLNFREKLKAKHRSILRSENGKNGTSINHSQLSNFGKFFGPSTPVIAERVIQESKSLLETRHLAPKVSTSQNDVKKVNMPSTSTSRNGSSEKPFPRQVKSKAQIIKQNRDYSQLLSEDADISKPAKELDPRKSLAPRPGFEDARSAQVRAKKIETSHHVKKEYDGREQRKLSSGSSQAHDSRRTISEKSTSGSRANYPSSDSRRQLDLRKQPQSNRHAGSSSGNGSRPTGSSSGNGSRLTGSSSGNGSRHAGSSSGNGSRQAGSISGNGSRPTVQKTLPPKYPSSSGDRKMSVGSVEKRPFSAPVGNKASAVSKTSTLDRQRPVVKPQASSVNSRLEHKRDVHRSTDSKTSKEYVAASKSQTMRPPNRSSSNSEKSHPIKQQKPVGQLQKSYAAPSKDHKIKKRRSPEPEDFDYRSEIRNLFRYNPSRFSNYDDDDDDMCMEAGFDAIQQEEKRSARIARQEDEEEWIKIQEEERRERLQKKAKMRRMR